MDLARLSRTITFGAFVVFVITLVGVFVYSLATGQNFTYLVIYIVEVGVVGVIVISILAMVGKEVGA